MFKIGDKVKTIRPNRSPKEGYYPSEYYNRIGIIVVSDSSFYKVTSTDRDINFCQFSFYKTELQKLGLTNYND